MQRISPDLLHIEGPAWLRSWSSSGSTLTFRCPCAAVTPTTPTVRAPETPPGISGGRFFEVLVEIEIIGDAQGVICSQRSRCGGYSLFMRDGKLVFVHDDPDTTPIERLACDIPAFGKHIVGVEYTQAYRCQRRDRSRDALRRRPADGALTAREDARPLRRVRRRTVDRV